MCFHCLLLSFRVLPRQRKMSSYPQVSATISFLSLLAFLSSIVSVQYKSFINHKSLALVGWVVGKFDHKQQYWQLPCCEISLYISRTPNYCTLMYDNVFRIPLFVKALPHFNVHNLTLIHLKCSLL